MAEINLMDRYPRSRSGTIDERGQPGDRCRSGATPASSARTTSTATASTATAATPITPASGKRRYSAFRDHYDLDDDDRVLDVGCAKGFMLHDFKELLPGLTVSGLDISQYAIDNAIETCGPSCRSATPRICRFRDNSFDLVTAINTIHNLALDECKQALREIERVSAVTLSSSSMPGATSESANGWSDGS